MALTPEFYSLKKLMVISTGIMSRLEMKIAFWGFVIVSRYPPIRGPIANADWLTIVCIEFILR